MKLGKTFTEMEVVVRNVTDIMMILTFKKSTIGALTVRKLREETGLQQSFVPRLMIDYLNKPTITERSCKRSQHEMKGGFTATTLTQKFNYQSRLVRNQKLENELKSKNTFMNVQKMKITNSQ